MNRLSKWRRLAPGRRCLLVEAAMLLMAVRTGLKLVPFQTLSRATRRLSRPLTGKTKTIQPDPEPIVWAVERAAKALLGKDACLAKALAGQVLLGRRGIPTRLRLGVRKTEAGSLLAHAWLEGEGGILLGGAAADLQPFAALPDLEASGG